MCRRGWVCCLRGKEGVGARGAMDVFDETAIGIAIGFLIGGKREGRCGM